MIQRRRLLTRLVLASGTATFAAAFQGRHAAASTNSAASAPRTSTKTLVEIDTGKLRGLASPDGVAFLGVPYASARPPAGRFRPPAMAEPWAGTLDATRYGPISPQENVAEKVRYFTAGGFQGTIPDHPQPQDEECLRLNVWTPSAESGRKRPVMVWLHGGSFIGGSANATWYDGARLANRHDLVVVGVNHRVGTLGFLYLGELLGEDFARSGNVGMADIIESLAWIRRNIERFGGDPGNVTIFGESGGGMKVSALLAMPQARGLFHRAVVQSGAGVRAHTTDEAARVTGLMVQELGLRNPDLASLQALPVDQIIAAQQRLVKRVRGGALTGVALEYRPVVDGVILPTHPFDPRAPDISADVPLIIGTNEMDASWGMWRDPDWDSMTDRRLRERLQSEIGEKAIAAIELYRAMYPQDSHMERYIRIRSRPTLSITLAERKADLGKAPCFMYLFAWNTPRYRGRLKSPHMLDVPFVFRNVTHTLEFTGDGPEVLALESAMSTAWAEFARSGVPASPEWPSWKPYDRQTRQTLVIGASSQSVADPNAPAREFWAR